MEAMMDWKAREEQEQRGAWPKATVTDGVARWTSNGQIPMPDMLATWARAGFAFDLAKTLATRDRETAEFLAEYRKRPRRLDPEARAEMRAAFGPGKRVVNIVTGRKYRT